MREPQHFGEMLKEMRVAYGMSQEKMAEMLIMSSKHYGRIERGDAKITAERFHSYSVIFNRNLLKQTGYVLDERFSAKDLLIKASKMLERMFVGGI
jgi:transcriptional regulator with XRE-family HTH domain